MAGTHIYAFVQIKFSVMSRPLKGCSKKFIYILYAAMDQTTFYRQVDAFLKPWHDAVVLAHFSLSLFFTVCFKLFHFVSCRFSSIQSIPTLANSAQPQLV